MHSAWPMDFIHGSHHLRSCPSCLSHCILCPFIPLIKWQHTCWKWSSDQFTLGLNSWLYIDLNAKKYFSQFVSEKDLCPGILPTWKKDVPLCGKFGFSDSLEWTGEKILSLLDFFNAFGSGIRKRSLILFPRNAVVLSEVMFLFISYSPSRDHTSLAELLGCVTRIPDHSATEKTEVWGHEHA